MSSQAFLKEDLIALRKELGLTQHGMADALDMALRAYQSLESGESEYRYIHRLAAERVALMMAADKKAPMLAPGPVRADAIELVRVGQLTANPEFHRASGGAGSISKSVESAGDTKFRMAYGVVGELVLITTALDHQLNHVLIQVLPLADSPMLESVVATLDMARKIEMLKARSKHIAQPSWQRPVLTYLDKLERISKWRNIACHTALIPDKTHGAVFAPAAAAKLLKTLEVGESPTTKRIPISELKSAITIAGLALGDGQNIIQNFQRMNAERIKRYGK